MDPLAHTLVGATLAESGLRRTSRLATPTLVLGANLPDVDAVTTFVDADLMYGFRRGWTHGVLAMAVLPWLLAGAMLLYARLRPFPGHDPPLRPARLVGLAHLGVLSHPLLDWLNDYGVRLLMPLDGTWYYGDAVFIVDPWMWLSMASAVVLARTRHRLTLASWVVLGLGTTALVLGAPMTPLGAKVAWCIFVAAIAGARALPGAPARAARVARIALAALVAYVGANVVGSAVARRQASTWLVARGLTPERVVAGAVPANPFERHVIALVDGRYRFLQVRWLGGTAIGQSGPDLPVGDGPIARRALAAAEVRGFARWLRLPAFEVETHADGTRVWIRDVRYVRMGSGFGSARVDLDAAGRCVAADLEH